MPLQLALFILFKWLQSLHRSSMSRHPLIKNGSKQLPIPKGANKMQKVTERHPGLWSKLDVVISPHPKHLDRIMLF